MKDIKTMVGIGRKVHFQYYRQKELWYVTDCGFQFPVPIEDVGDGVFKNEDKAILFMRYIRKHLDHIESSKVAFVAS